MESPHSAAFIEEMRLCLEEEREALASELASLAKRDKGDFQAHYPEYGRSEEDNATESADFQAFATTTEAAEARLKEVAGALERIGAGSYGVTEAGEVIPEERLRANPAATTIITTAR